MSIGDTNKLSISLKEIIGTETHKATSDVITELAGRTGEIIKGFTVQQLGKNL